MTRGVAAALLGLAAACSQLSESNGGIATLDVRLPANSFLEQERPLRLTAVARNRNGDSARQPACGATLGFGTAARPVPTTDETSCRRILGI